MQKCIVETLERGVDLGEQPLFLVREPQQKRQVLIGLRFTCRATSFYGQVTVFCRSAIALLRKSCFC